MLILPLPSSPFPLVEHKKSFVQRRRVREEQQNLQELAAVEASINSASRSANSAFGVAGTDPHEHKESALFDLNEVQKKHDFEYLWFDEQVACMLFTSKKEIKNEELINTNAFLCAAPRLLMQMRMVPMQQAIGLMMFSTWIQ